MRQTGLHPPSLTPDIRQPLSPPSNPSLLESSSPSPLSTHPLSPSSSHSPVQPTSRPHLQRPPLANRPPRLCPPPSNGRPLLSLPRVFRPFAPPLTSANPPTSHLRQPSSHPSPNPPLANPPPSSHPSPNPPQSVGSQFSDCILPFPLTQFLPLHLQLDSISLPSSPASATVRNTVQSRCLMVSSAT